MSANIPKEIITQLIEIGRHNREEVPACLADPEKAWISLICGWQPWRLVAQEMSESDLENLIRGYVLYTRARPTHSGGGITMKRILTLVTVFALVVMGSPNYGSFIEAANARMPADNNAVFLGLETLSNIAYVDIIQFQNDGLVTLFDDIRFESTTPVPLPSAALLFGSGLVMVWGRIAWDRRRRINRNF
jgi:hypothetical protein